MTFADIMKGVSCHVVCGGGQEIKGIAIDSRRIEKGWLYAAIPGLHADGHDYIAQAAERGAIGVICEKIPRDMPENMAYALVENTREALGYAASNFFGNPSKELTLVGVTGTKGKTSTTYYLEEILKKAGKSVGIIGTTGAKVNGRELGISYAASTTPDALELHTILRKMADMGTEYVVMEVSSHALALKKMAGLRFRAGIFTNLSQDHLDFHKDMDDYMKAKAELFKICDIGLVNADSPYSQYIFSLSQSNIFTFGLDGLWDFQARNVELLQGGVNFMVTVAGREYSFHIPVPGRFTVYNALGVIGAAYQLGIPTEAAAAALKELPGVPGRYEKVEGGEAAFIVDYAHSPDSLLNILQTAREFTQGRLIALFGCGGDRDRTKRPVMGRIGGEIADYCILTSDNPRNENPEAIIEEIREGIAATGCPYETVTDRREAIYKAVSMGKAGDTVIIAGKGHEDYQEFEKGRKIHFSDKETVEEAIGIKSAGGKSAEDSVSLQIPKER